jgi:hypothetical protein
MRTCQNETRCVRTLRRRRFDSALCFTQNVRMFFSICTYVFPGLYVRFCSVVRTIFSICTYEKIGSDRVSEQGSAKPRNSAEPIGIMGIQVSSRGRRLPIRTIGRTVVRPYIGSSRGRRVVVARSSRGRRVVVARSSRGRRAVVARSSRGRRCGRLRSSPLASLRLTSIAPTHAVPAALRAISTPDCSFPRAGCFVAALRAVSGRVRVCPT